MTRLLWLVSIVLLATSPLEAEEPDLRSEVPSLPPSMSLTGSLVRDGRWYALGSNEIACINKLLAGKAWSMPEGVTHVSLPPINNKIILWGRDGAHLTATDVIELDDNAYFLWSERNVHYYNGPDSNERKSLAELIHRIKNGSEQAVAGDEEKLGPSRDKTETENPPTCHSRSTAPRPSSRARRGGEASTPSRAA